MMQRRHIAGSGGYTPGLLGHLEREELQLVGRYRRCPLPYLVGEGSCNRGGLMVMARIMITREINKQHNNNNHAHGNDNDMIIMAGR